jgi:hypothetical protein
MQSDNSVEANKLEESQLSTPKKTAPEELTFGRSPIKTPRSIHKLNNSNANFVQSRIFGRLSRREERGEGSKDQNGIDYASNNLRKRKEEATNKPEAKQRENPSEGFTQRSLAPKPSSYEEEPEEANFDPEAYKKKKKDWKSWSLQEKELFYEAIANGGNYSSLQKLFKNMNDVIKFYNFIFHFKIFRKSALKVLKRSVIIIIVHSKM